MIETSAGVVVAGAGAAGHSAARTLRQEGYTGPLTVLHHEAHAPYNRTLVNKAVLQGLLTAAQVALPSLDDLDVHLVRAGVHAIEPDDSVLVLDNGERLPYSTLVAATGSTPRPPSPYFGVAARLVHIHTVDDAAADPRLVPRRPRCHDRHVARRGVHRRGDRQLPGGCRCCGSPRLPADGPARRRARRAHRATRHRAPCRARDDPLRSPGPLSLGGCGLGHGHPRRRTRPGVRLGRRGPRHCSGVCLDDRQREGHRRGRPVASRGPSPRVRRRRRCRAHRSDGRALPHRPLGRRQPAREHTRQERCSTTTPAARTLAPTFHPPATTSGSTGMRSPPMGSSCRVRWSASIRRVTPTPSSPPSTSHPSRR